MADYYQNEDGAGRFLLEDGSGLLLLELQGVPSGPAGGAIDDVERYVRRRTKYLGKAGQTFSEAFAGHLQEARRRTRLAKVVERQKFEDEDEMILILIAIAALYND